MRRRKFTIDLGTKAGALHDVLTEFGANWTLEFRGEPPPGLREMCADAVEETPGLVVRFIANPVGTVVPTVRRRSSEK